MTNRHLNLGCGQRFHPEWVNLDLHSTSPSVQQWDLQRDLPFPDESFDVVYHSHLLEHLSKDDGLQLLNRCRRVLKPNGILRVVVPDLERIAQLYLQALREALSGNREWQSRYDWAMLEMYDQTVRESSGGEMASFVQKGPPSLMAFLRERLGGEVDGILRLQQTSTLASSPAARGERFRRKLLRLLIGRERVFAYEHGRFRRSGEVHKWMYDRYSLGKILCEAGFIDPQVLSAAESRVPGWSSFHLDTEPDGRVYKPDSLFMEATRP